MADPTEAQKQSYWRYTITLAWTRAIGSNQPP